MGTLRLASLTIPPAGCQLRRDTKKSVAAQDDEYGAPLEGGQEVVEEAQRAEQQDGAHQQQADAPGAEVVAAALHGGQVAGLGGGEAAGGRGRGGAGESEARQEERCGDNYHD